MLTSMTGFGAKSETFDNYQIAVEIKCLNARYPEHLINLPRFLRDKEFEIRNILTKQLERGKIYFTLNLTFKEDKNPHQISFNHALAQSYWAEMLVFAEKNTITLKSDNLNQLFKMPELWQQSNENTEEGLWKDILRVIEQSIQEVIHFRNQEGEAIGKLLRENVGIIEDNLAKVADFEHQRIPMLQEKLKNILEDNKVNIDENRLLQELVYYAEKYDIAEEKNRLANHCSFFKETLYSKENNGKKLGFITQEMLREINTLGAKANQSDIQKLVVVMKEEVEKIKEQLNNIA